MRTLTVALVAASLLCRAPTLLAQDDGKSPSKADLAREFNDPLTVVPQLFVQDAYTPSNYGTDAQTNRVIARLIVPRVPHFRLFPFPQLIRPSLSLVTVPTGVGSETRTEFGDIQLFDLAVLPWPGKESGLMMDTSSKQPPLSTLVVQPILLQHLWKGLYVKSADASWAFGWRDGSATTIPLSLGLGYVIPREGSPPLNFFVSGEWMVHRENAPVAPQTTVRFGVTVAFPQLQPW